MKIGHNLMASNAIRNTNANSLTASKSMGKLSSGLAITNAADNAAGLAVSEKMKGQIRGLDQASKNAQDGVSLIQTADGALSETTSILQRMRELANQSSNDSNTSADRGAIQTETNELVAQLDNIANTTQFNTKNLLNGGAGLDTTSTHGIEVSSGNAGVVAGAIVTLSTVVKATSASMTFAANVNADNIVVGANSSLSINGTTINLTAGTTGADVAAQVSALSGQTGVIATYTAATAGTKGSLVFSSSATGSAAEMKISGIDADADGIGAGNTFVASTAANAVNHGINAAVPAVGVIAAATKTAINGADASATVTTSGAAAAGGTITSQGNILTMHGTGVEGLQINVANTDVTAAGVVTVNGNNSLSMQIGANKDQTMSVSINSMTASTLHINALDLTTKNGANAALAIIDTATATVSSERAKLGAYQNRLESTINNLGTTAENLTSAQSSVSDVDMAREMAEYSKNNVLSQASQAMLAQANQQPQQVLKLLQ